LSVIIVNNRQNTAANPMRAAGPSRSDPVFSLIRGQTAKKTWDKYSGQIQSYRPQREAGIEIAAGGESMARPARQLGPSDCQICGRRRARLAGARPGGDGRTDGQPDLLPRPRLCGPARRRRTATPAARDLLPLARYEADRLARCEARMARRGKSRPTRAEGCLDCAQQAPRAAGRLCSLGGTLRASARPLALAGCRVAARGELAGFIFTIDCYSGPI
jgi:hypothetical protein